MPGKLFDLGHEVPDYSVPEPEGGDGERKKRKVFPEVHIQADGSKLPDFPAGEEFWIVARAKVVGIRDPADEGREKSMDLALLNVGSITDEQYNGIPTGENKSSRDITKSFRASVASSMKGG